MSADAEAVLAAYPWRLDPETLREVIDDRAPIEAAREQLDAEIAALAVPGRADDAALARLYGLRSVTNRLLDSVDGALADGKQALEYAVASGSLRRVAIARTRLAHAYQRSGDHAAADREYARADCDDLPARLHAAIHQRTGTCCFEQGRHIEACEHFEKALALHPDAEPEFVEAVETGLEAVLTAAALKGWGPYRRSRPELFGEPPVPVCHRDTTTGRWGYEHLDGGWAIEPMFDEARPFSEGKAWVRFAGALGWEVIDVAGERLMHPIRCREPEPFSEGISWIHLDAAPDSWQAIDAGGGIVISPTGYEDPRPFRFGVSVLRRGNVFGAIDRYGEIAIPFDYEDFCTATADRRHITGFTAEGLAVVDRLGRRGVLDTTGRQILPPCYEDVNIHPVGFLVKLADAVYPHPSDEWAIPGDPGTWGVVGRNGRVLIEPQHLTRSGVLADLEGRMRASRPIL